MKLTIDKNLGNKVSVTRDNLGNIVLDIKDSNCCCNHNHNYDVDNDCDIDSDEYDDYLDILDDKGPEYKKEETKGKIRELAVEKLELLKPYLYYLDTIPTSYVDEFIEDSNLEVCDLLDTLLEIEENGHHGIFVEHIPYQFIGVSEHMIDAFAKSNCKVTKKQMKSDLEEMIKESILFSFAMTLPEPDYGINVKEEIAKLLEKKSQIRQGVSTKQNPDSFIQYLLFNLLDAYHPYTDLEKIIETHPKINKVLEKDDDSPF